MKIVIVIPVYKRPEIWEISARNLALFIENELSNDYDVACILSNDDPDFTRNYKTCKKHGFEYCVHPNFPVSDKQNAGIRYAMDLYNPDYMMHLGSDNLISPRLMERYRPFMIKKTPFFGVHKLYFYDYATEKTILFTTKPGTGAIGPGRMIHKSVLSEFKGEGYNIYPSGINCHMDGGSAARIIGKGFEELVLELHDFPYIVDIKTSENITQFEYLAGMNDLYSTSDKSELTGIYNL